MSYYYDPAESNETAEQWKRLWENCFLWGWVVVVGLFVILLILGAVAAGVYRLNSSEKTPEPQFSPATAIALEPSWVERMANLTTNAAWQPIIQEIEGVEMVLVPKGCFIMGQPPTSSVEAEAQQVCFETPFWIDRYEVSNLAYLTHKAAPACESRWCEDDRPRENISYAEADAFCRLRGGRLPTAAEWEYAARGVESWLYPWGNIFQEDAVAYRALFTVEGEGNQPPHTYPIEAFPQGASWVGAEQLLGNVQEWVDQPTRDGRNLLRGGSALNNDLDLLTETTFGTLAENEDFNGFRCLHP